MKKVSRRALFALALAAVLAVGTLAFCVKYAANAEKWVTFSGSPHVYTGTNLTGGRIYDRSGVRILNTTDGRVYSDDEAVREATVHKTYYRRSSTLAFGVCNYNRFITFHHCYAAVGGS